MKRVVNPRSVTQTVCFVVVLCAFSATVLAKTSDMQKVATDNNQFACDLYAKLVKKQGGNLFFAPHSISTALAMTYAGAEGQTAAQMARVLHFRLPQTRLHRAFGQLVSTITARSKQGKVRLSIANALWGQKRYGFAEAFLETVRTHYAAAVERLDFKKDPSRARMDINRWVEKKTNQKIKDLIPQGVIKKDTRLVLTNAVYFLASWARAFEKYRTQKGDFHLPDGRKRKVAMMNAKRSFPYMVGRGFRALELPYRGHRLGWSCYCPISAKGSSRSSASSTQSCCRACLVGSIGKRSSSTCRSSSCARAFGWPKRSKRWACRERFPIAPSFRP
jgi:serpin B